LNKNWGAGSWKGSAGVQLRLTSAGQRFFKFLETSLKRYQSLTEELNELKGLQKGLLRMAAPFTTLYHLVPSALKNYITQFPNVELTDPGSVTAQYSGFDKKWGYRFGSGTGIPKHFNSHIFWCSTGRWCRTCTSFKIAFPQAFPLIK